MRIKSLVKYISNFFRGFTHVVGSLLGIKWRGEWDPQGIILAGWVFLIGTPVGMLIIGAETFSIGMWLTLVVLILMLANMDDALTMMSNYLTYGVDGEQVSPYETVEE